MVDHTKSGMPDKVSIDKAQELNTIAQGETDFEIDVFAQSFQEAQSRYYAYCLVGLASNSEHPWKKYS